MIRHIASEPLPLMKHYPSLLLSLVLSAFCTQSLAVQIVRIQLDYNNTTKTMDLELFDTIAPASVANFLNYVNNDGINGFRFNNTFIARSIPGFILQTGSYTFRPVDPLCEFLRPIGATYVGETYDSIICTDVNGNPIEFTSALEPVPTDGVVVNNFNLSNIRGTVAYARTSVVDSATSGWFINLEDNSANLDFQNEGFTVFGSVIDDGMVFADEMATFPIQPYAAGALGPDFANLPVVNYDFTYFPGIYQSNLLMLSSFTLITRPILRLAPVELDFQLDIAGDSTPKLLTTTLRNTGNEALLVGAIANIPAPFSIITNGCSGVILDPQTSTCDLVVSFSPTAVGIFTNNLTISYTSTVDSAPFNVTYPVTGEGVPVGAVSTVSAAAITYNGTVINTVSNDVVTIRNKGGSPLTINAVNLTGIDSSQFTIDYSACLNNTLSMNATCDLIVSFAPLTIGVKTATIEILTNSNTSTVTLNGTGTIPVLSAPSSLNLVSSVNTQVFDSFLAQNIGSADLIVSSIILSGPDAAFFASGNDCIDANNQGYPILSGTACNIIVVFTPTDNSIRTATLTLTTNDPITPTFSVSLTGTTIGFGDTDSDGIIDSIELASPNGGDGNNDGITDDLQNNVATFDAPNSNYITFISDNVLASGLETSIANIVLINSIPAGQPDTASFDYGLYSYSIILPATGDSVNMGILLPANENPTAFYKYGPTTDNTTPHWYDFSYDATTGTGAQFMGQVTYAGLQKNLVIVSYIDGLRGDDDLQPNGSILNSTSGLSFSNAIDSGSSSGSITYMQIFILLIISICRKRVIHIKN